ncbi:hypothetical protein IB279_13645 [Ensifer sp. ENS06]|uniref:hypothetical protein n=1 Tax=Ensifer sp. ENS06 TaxID=2769276 RepID=UPI0017861AC7|nr:hypothetical protein [Ensifer sp. ENS06]MBD9623986.1 hypothetical protein [Ensifer sp. ENS06]
MHFENKFFRDLTKVVAQSLERITAEIDVLKQFQAEEPATPPGLREILETEFPGIHARLSDVSSEIREKKDEYYDVSTSTHDRESLATLQREIGALDGERKQLETKLRECEALVRKGLVPSVHEGIRDAVFHNEDQEKIRGRLETLDLERAALGQIRDEMDTLKLRRRDLGGVSARNVDFLNRLRSVATGEYLRDLAHTLVG